MSWRNSITRMVLKIGALAVFGFLAITFAGPILAFGSMALFCALVGFLLWLPLHTLVFGSQARWRPAWERGQAWTQHVASIVGHGAQSSVFWVRTLHDAIRGTASVLGVVLIESLSGALVAVLLLWAVRHPQALTPPSVVLAAGVGASVGLLVVLSRRKPLRIG